MGNKDDNFYRLEQNFKQGIDKLNQDVEGLMQQVEEDEQKIFEAAKNLNINDTDNTFINYSQGSISSNVLQDPKLKATMQNTLREVRTLVEEEKHESERNSRIAKERARRRGNARKINLDPNKKQLCEEIFDSIRKRMIEDGKDYSGRDKVYLYAELMVKFDKNDLVHSNEFKYKMIEDEGVDFYCSFLPVYEEQKYSEQRKKLLQQKEEEEKLLEDKQNEIIESILSEIEECCDFILEKKKFELTSEEKEKNKKIEKLQISIDKINRLPKFVRNNKKITNSVTLQTDELNKLKKELQTINEGKIPARIEDSYKKVEELISLLNYKKANEVVYCISDLSSKYSNQRLEYKDLIEYFFNLKHKATMIALDKEVDFKNNIDNELKEKGYFR